MKKTLGILATCSLALAVLGVGAAGAADSSWTSMRGKAPTGVDRAGKGVTRPADLERHASELSYDDAVGDTFGTLTPQIDVVRIDVEALGNSFIVQIKTKEPISARDSGQANALTGFVDLDLDQDPGTGADLADALSLVIPIDVNYDFGSDAFVDLDFFDSATGLAPLVDSLDFGNVLGDVQVAFVNDVVAIVIPLSLLGSDGEIDVAATVGTLDEPTDFAPDAGPATSLPNTIASLSGDRFQVSVDWEDFQGNTGSGRVITGSPDTGIFYFFSADNWEMMVKVLDACSFSNHFWVFAAATTDVEYTLTVVDTQTQIQKVYNNPLGTAAPAITDTAAFATCP